MSPDDAERRIRELEDQVRRLKTESAIYKETVYDLLRNAVPRELPSEEELERLVAAPEGRPIADILDELERELS